MGLFSSRKKIYVSSVVYNLAGPIEDRPDYLKSIILGNMLTQKRFKVTDVVRNTYLNGTGTRLRAYHRWSRTNYKQIGISTDRFYGSPEFNAEEVALVLKTDFGLTAFIDWIDSGPADISMWGRQWLREHLPEKEPLDIWTVDYVEATKVGLITFTDGTAPIQFTPLGYRDSGDWLYVSYSRPTQVNRWTTPKLFIYERGTGSAALDALFTGAQEVGEYLPFIPLRHEGKFISENYKPEVYTEAKKAYKKAFGGKYDELIDKVAENESIAEIDFAYVVLGVSMNIKDTASKRYMFNYFKHLLGSQVSSATHFNNWAGAQPSAADGILAWLAWRAAQNANPPGSPVTGPAPDRPGLSGPPTNTVVIQDRGPGRTNLKLEIAWNSMELTGGMGLGKPDAKVGEVWFTFAGSQTIVLSAYTEDEIEDLEIDTVEMHYQKTDQLWEKLTIKGMVHRNHIYEGKFVEITAAQALLDVDESGFIVPIHYEIFREMSLVDATQMATQSANIVFNCYQIVKKKWYQRGWFKVLLAVVVIVLTIMYPPAGMAAGSGLLGTGAAVGAALGFAGLAAVIAGAIANMIAAMILTKLITYVAVEALGERIGYIVAAIASFMTLQIGTAIQAGQSLASIWSSMTNVTNLLYLTNSVGNAYTQVLAADTMEYVVKTQDALEDFRQQSLELQSNYAENFGYGTALFNPMSLTEAGESFFTENSETFLSRTLLTGSDIAQMGNDMIANFVELTLNNQFEE